MKAIPLPISDVILLEPGVFSDERGCFFESYNRNAFREATGCNAEFVQDNHSCSVQWVLRGLHYQTAPKAQGKLVRVIQGEVFDVAVDIRRGSPTFGKWVSEILSARNRRQIWIPPGFAHGFLTLSESAQFLYKTTDYYSPTHERCIHWNDPVLRIAWPLETDPLLSNKDKHGVSLDRADLA